MEIKVDKDKCTGCKECQRVCFNDAIEIKEGVAVINNNCVYCSACVMVCKFNAIKLIGVKKI